MSVWRQLKRGLRSLGNRSVADDEIAEEAQQYFEDAAAAGRAQGLSAEEAQNAARREMGSMTAVREQARSYGWENAVRGFAADIRFAARQLWGSPGFTIVSVLTLALGIGATSAIFSAVNPILFAPLPYPESSRIMMIWSAYKGTRSEVAFGTYRELAERSRSFESMAVFEPWQPAMTGGTQPERLNGQSVSADFFRVLGFAPAQGRDFLTGEDVFNGPKVVILSDRLWKRYFNSDPAIAGRQIRLDGDNYTVIGVMPRGYENVLSPSAEIWTPEQYDTRQLAAGFNSWEWGNHLRLIGRIRPGVTEEEARQEMDGIARAPWPQFPRPRWASLNHGMIVDSLQDDIAHSVKPALLAILGAVSLLLTIACVNVVNLLLARSAQRRGEFAVRAALGASRSRIVRQLVTEGLLLALFGGAAGMGVAAAGVHLIVLLSPPGLPGFDVISLDKSVFVFALGITTLIGVVSGLVPALSVSRSELGIGIQQSSRRTAGGQSLTRRALVVTEVALALVLLIGAGLLIRSMRRVLSVASGFSPSHLLTMQVQTSGHQFDDVAGEAGSGDKARRRFFEQALDAVRRVPGVKQAAFTSLLPLSDDPPVVGEYGAHFENDDPQGGHNVFRYAVSPDYFQTMGIPLRGGRFLDEHDTESAPQVALISESLAKRQFPGESAIGKRLHVGPTNRPWYTVVGVVGNVKQSSLAIDEPDAVYLSTEQTWFADDTLSFVIRTQGDAAALAPAVKNAIWSVDRNQPIVRVVPMTGLLAVSEAERRFVLNLFGIFGLVALVLAAVGIYGILAGSVTERTREIGVRSALGASRANILGLVLRDGMRLTGLGMAIGLCAAVAASRAMVSLLFGVSRVDLTTYLGMIALLGVVSGIACWMPAWRAARVDPSITLRAE